MYLPIGGDMAVRTKAIVGIFGLDNTTTSRHTRQFCSWQNRRVRWSAQRRTCQKPFSLPANTACPGIYLTQFNAATLEKRLHISGVSQRTGSTQKKNQPAAEGRCKPFRRCRLI